MTIKETARQAARQAHPNGVINLAMVDAMADAVAVAVLWAERERVYHKQRLFEPNEGAYNALAQLLEESAAMLAEFTPAPMTPCGHTYGDEVPCPQCPPDAPVTPEPRILGIAPQPGLRDTLAAENERLQEALNHVSEFIPRSECSGCQSARVVAEGIAAERQRLQKGNS